MPPMAYEVEAAERWDVTEVIAVMARQINDMLVSGETIWVVFGRSGDETSSQQTTIQLLIEIVMQGGALIDYGGTQMGLGRIPRPMDVDDGGQQDPGAEMIPLYAELVTEDSCDVMTMCMDYRVKPMRPLTTDQCRKWTTDTVHRISRSQSG